MLKKSLATLALSAGLVLSCVAAETPAIVSHSASLALAKKKHAKKSKKTAQKAVAAAVARVFGNAAASDFAASPAADLALSGGGGAPKPAPKAWYQNLTINGQAFADYTYYARSGYGPQFLTQMGQEAPGNDGYNAFDVTRTYINFFVNPKGAVTLRITPNIYLNSDGNRNYRLKYANIAFNHPFSGSDAFGQDAIVFGQTTDPLVDFSEGLFGYRYIALTPWNYLGFSSTFVGADVHGPIMIDGRQQFRYMIGVYNETSFHHIEAAQGKSIMGRFSWYPGGTSKDKTGFAVTLFDEVGAANNPPSSTNHTKNNTFAGIVSYQTHNNNYLIAGEYDLGYNALGAGSLFSGDGNGTGSAPGDLAPIASSVLGGESRQRGFDVFGHARLGSSPASLVFMIQRMQPNLHVSNDPLDFTRAVIALSYAVNKNLSLAVSSSNFFWNNKVTSFGTTTLNSNDQENTNAIGVDAQYNF